MKFWINFSIPVILAIIAITLISTQGFLSSLKYGFDSIYLFPLNILIYIGTSFWITKHISRKYGIRAAVLIGFYEAVVAWELQNELNPEPFYPKNPIAVLAVILFVFITILLGKIGAWLATKDSTNYNKDKK